MERTETKNVKVEIVLDVICAASYIAFVRLRRAIEKVRADGAKVEVAVKPFLLAPDADFDGEPLLDVLTARFGEHVVAETRQAAADAVRDGVTLAYERAVAADTFEAHRLIASAAARGLAEPMAERLFRAHFTDGLNIADLGTLERLAAEIGVDRNDAAADEVRAELAGVYERGIRSVPWISFNDGPAAVGARPEKAYFQALRASRACT
ncbi:DsbA family protein [Streptosporangium lutulentum]|uniref:DsbA family dithiol-disulfide isomerase n=1 Tax=Streptosporangium lutulentum TaxID=1461250 RepID=A0ABT9QCX9_9ACTN|nr:DsbA family protein [Streptosporangium lutulentum]MDP9843919.1 putative DsbA family dithiol-disulfide isomerase [Streptosporangium lutulentum]